MLRVATGGVASLGGSGVTRYLTAFGQICFGALSALPPRQSLDFFLLLPPFPSLPIPLQIWTFLVILKIADICHAWVFLKLCLTIMGCGCCPDRKVYTILFAEKFGAPDISEALDFVHSCCMVVRPLSSGNHRREIFETETFVGAFWYTKKVD